jgi:hypothetical protein
MTRSSIRAAQGRKGSLDFLNAQARSAYQATRYDAAGHILPGLIRGVETAARIADSGQPGRLRGARWRLRHHGAAAEPSG